MNVENERIAELAQLGFHAAVGHVMKELAQRDPYFSLIYSDCGNRFQAGLVQEVHPEKCYEVGIAEQNQVGMAAAMALEGYHVFALAYAPFITARVLDQIRVDLGYMNAPVKLIGLGAGLSIGDLGATHMAIEDIANLRGIPNLVIMSPADCLELAKMLEASLTLPAPVYIRVTVGKSGQRIYERDYDFQIGKAVVLRTGRDVLFVSSGSILQEVVGAAEILSEAGVSATVLNMHTIKPLDTETLARFLDHKIVVTVEEHCDAGGLGGAVSEYLAAMPQHPPLLRMALPDHYFCANTPEKLREKAGLTGRQIAEKTKAFLNAERWSK